MVYDFKFFSNWLGRFPFTGNLVFQKVLDVHLEVLDKEAVQNMYNN